MHRLDGFLSPDGHYLHGQSLKVNHMAISLFVVYFSHMSVSGIHLDYMTGVGVGVSHFHLKSMSQVSVLWHAACRQTVCFLVLGPFCNSTM